MEVAVPRTSCEVMTLDGMVELAVMRDRGGGSGAERRDGEEER